MRFFRLILIVLLTTCAPHAQALTLTQSFSVAEQYTDWSQAFAFDKFDSNLGVLTDVQVDFSASILNSAVFAYSGSGTGRFMARFANTFLLSDWNGEEFMSSRSVSTTRWVTHKNSAQNYNYTNGSSTVLGELYLTNYLNSFIGADDIDLSLSVSTLFTLSNAGSGISLLNELTASSAQLSLIYTYLPAPAPDLIAAPDSDSGARQAFAPAPDEAYSAPTTPLIPSAADDLPEPSALSLLALGLIALAGSKRRSAAAPAIQPQFAR